MAETTPLKSNMIVRNATVGASLAHGPVKTGELPHVQMRATPGNPQVQTPPQKPVEILAPRNAESAVRTGGLPMINVIMTSQGPQPNDGQDRPTVILSKGPQPALAAGGLPAVQVRGVDQPRGGGFVVAPSGQARGGVQAGQSRVMRVAAPAPAPVALPPMPEFSADQLMLCRHLVDRYLTDLRAVDSAAPEVAEVKEPGSDHGALAEATIGMIDQALITVAVRAEAEARAAVALQEAQAAAALQEAPVAVPPARGGSIIPVAPSVSHVAGRVVGRTSGYAQRNAAMAPRRVPRGSAPGGLPPVIVKMDGGRAIVQNQAEVAAARAAVLEQPPPEAFDDGSQG